MNEINDILNFFEKKVNSSNVLEPPTKSEIIDILGTWGVDNPGEDNVEQVDKITKYVRNSVNKYEDYFLTRNKDINLNYLEANQGGYRVINILFDEDNIPGGLESISLCIPVFGRYLSIIIPRIYRYLLSNRISFLSKISFYNRSDNFVVTVYNKNDAIGTINFCNDNFKQNLGVVNPFIATLGKIGVSRTLYEKNYNLGIANLINEYIEDCILKQRKKTYDAIDFQNFVNEQYKQSINYVDRNMNLFASASLYSILTKDNILKFFKDDISLVFDYDNYYRYEAVNISGEYEYLYSGKVVNRDTDYICWVKLQALNCLNKIYLEQVGEPFKNNTKISEKFTFKILRQLDNVLDKYGNYNICISYNDNEIQKMIPYLYIYMAYKYKGCNIEEIKKLSDKIKSILIIKKNNEKDKITYEQNKQKIESSFPIINTLEGSVAIEMIDYKTGMCNILNIKKGIRTSYLNVYIKVNYELLRNNNLYQSKRYRYAVAKSILDENRNKDILEKRKNDFSILFFDDTKEISKYIKVENV